MTPNLNIHHALEPAVDDLVIAERDVSRLAHCGPDERWKAPVRDAIATLRTLIRPKARWMAVNGASEPTSFAQPIEITALFPAHSPVENIIRRGTAWLFVATIGDALEARVRELFDANHYLEAVLLDAAGSVSVEAVCDQAESVCAQGQSSSRFSPGYCSWSLQAQPLLLSYLDAESFGVRLMPSLLMRPLKSVSGAIVQAEPEALLVPPKACRTCDARGCTRRRSAAKKGSSRGRAA